MDTPKIKISKKLYNALDWIPIIAGLITSIFIFGIAYVPTESMEPTIMTNDAVFYTFMNGEKADYDDIILVANSPEPVKISKNLLSVSLYSKKGEILCKRVIGLPGDVIEVKEGYVWRNGTKLDPAYLPELTYGTFGPYTVPEGKIFCMGDNRNVSMDSRVLGPFPQENVIGHVRLWSTQISAIWHHNSNS